MITYENLLDLERQFTPVKRRSNNPALIKPLDADLTANLTAKIMKVMQRLTPAGVKKLEDNGYEDMFS